MAWYNSKNTKIKLKYITFNFKLLLIDIQEHLWDLFKCSFLFYFTMEPWYRGDGDTALWVVNKLQMFTSYAGICIFPLLGCVTIII